MPDLRLSFHRAQRAFVLHDAFLLAFIAGIGSGKSRAGVARSLLAAAGRIGNREVSVPNFGIVTAPTYPMLKDATLESFFDVAGQPGEGIIKSYNKSQNLMMLKNGSKIAFRSTDNAERLRGSNASWWFGDEAALYDATVWPIMLGRLRQFGARGSAWLTTTPKGRNWLYQRFIQQQNDGYAVVRAATKDNTFLSADFVQSVYGEYTGDYARQELAGDFVAFSGLVYSEFDERTHTAAAMPDGLRHYAAIDYGYTNPGVILIGGVDGDGRLYVVHEEYQRERRIEDWVSIASKLHQQYRVIAWWCDPSATDYIDALNAHGVPVDRADNAVNTGLDAVRARLAIRGDGLPRLMLSASAVNTRAEFGQYQWVGHKGGYLERPQKQSDHAMDALRYLVRGIDGDVGSFSVASIGKYR